jgi:hypothetical protein
LKSKSINKYRGFRVFDSAAARHFSCKKRRMIFSDGALFKVLFHCYENKSSLFPLSCTTNGKTAYNTRYIGDAATLPVLPNRTIFAGESPKTGLAAESGILN